MTCESVSDLTTRNINRHSYVPVVHDGGFGDYSLQNASSTRHRRVEKSLSVFPLQKRRWLEPTQAFLDFIRDADQRRVG